MTLVNKVLRRGGFASWRRDVALGYPSLEKGGAVATSTRVRACVRAGCVLLVFILRVCEGVGCASGVRACVCVRVRVRAYVLRLLRDTRACVRARLLTSLVW